MDTSASPASTSSRSVAEVCIGMPVYNGAGSLAAVLENLTEQSFRDIVIVISDNGSNDDTPTICTAWAARDPRITVHRQPKTVPATDNFNFVLGQCRSPYFMWAAHDDLRDAEYVASLLKSLKGRTDAILAFGDIIEYKDGRAAPLQLDFATEGISPGQRLKWAALSQLHHLYGLWRAEALQRITWEHVDWWHDTPLMLAASQLGEFIHVPGAMFHYTSNQHHFLDWLVRPEGKGGHSHWWHVIRRARDLVRLIRVSRRTVARVAGPWAGIVAAVWTMVKIASQIGGYVKRRARWSMREKGKQA